jgi:hypothetical protein
MYITTRRKLRMSSVVKILSSYGVPFDCLTRLLLYYLASQPTYHVTPVTYYFNLD